MKKLIQEIVNTDKASRLDVEKAVARREQLNDEINEQKAAFDEKCNKKAQKKITEAREQSERETEAAKADLEKSLEKKTDLLNEIYAQKHEAWEKEIFERVIG